MSYNIFETVVKGSNTVFLDIPSEQYFSYYDRLDKSQQITQLRTILLTEEIKKMLKLWIQNIMNTQKVFKYQQNFKVKEIVYGKTIKLLCDFGFFRMYFYFVII